MQASPQHNEVACQTDLPLYVDTALLPAQVVTDLAMQLHGLADCLASLPTSEVEAIPAEPHSPSSGHHAAPVFCGPPTDSGDVAGETLDRVALRTEDEGDGGDPDASRARSVSSHPYLCLLVGFVLTVRSGAPHMGYLLWLLVSVEGVSGSYFTPNASESGDEESHTEAVPEGHRPGDGPHSRPAGPPPPTPAGVSDAHDPADARLVYNESAPPDLNFLPGSMRSVHVTRRFPTAMIIRWVQNRLIRHQHGMLPATAFLNGPIPQGTPFRFHNPFTSRAQCHEVGYQEPEHIPPLGVLQAHADNRGWRGVVLLNPQPDSAAVHLIALPQHGHLASVALLVNNRVVPCCVPRRARWRELRSIAFEGVRGRLDLPSHIEVVQDTVTFRSGDCFRVDTADDRTAASEYALLEDVDSENAEPSLQPVTADVSCSRQLGPVHGVLLGLLLPLARQPWSWFLTFGLASALAMHRPGGFPWSVPQHERVFRLPNSDDPVQLLYYSPFLGSFPAYWAAPDTDHTTAWAQFRNDDAAWATDFFPVWPGLHFNALAFVPVGSDCATVTVILHYRGFGRAVLMPRTVTDSWLQSFASQQVSADIADIFLPHALEAWRFYDVPPPDYRLRNGDVLYLTDRVHGRDPLEDEEPWDIQTSGTGQHAPWAVGFRLDSDTVVDLLQPGQRPSFTTIPAGETWAPVQCTFSGEFHLSFQGCGRRCNGQRPVCRSLS